MEKLINYSVYIDSQLSTFDKDFFQKVTKFFDECGSEIICEFEKKSILPRVCVFKDLKNDEISSDDFVFKLKDQNIDLFSSPLDEKHESNFFEVQSVEEIKGLWPLVVSGLMTKIIELEKDIYHKKLKKMRTCLNTANKQKESSKEKKFLDDLLRMNSIDYSDINNLLIKANLKEMQLLPLWKALGEADFNDYLPIYHGTGFFYLKNAAKFPVVFNYLYLFYSRSLDWIKCKKIFDDTVEIKTLIPVPVILFNKDCDVLTYNQKFSELNISVAKSLELKNGDQFEIQNRNYRVVVRYTDDGKREVLFFPVDEYIALGNAPNSQELGIISSSLAHELNNPLGGILAALNVLELDAQGENKVIIDEMKEGVLRCKELVETFLGFSRLSPNSEQNFCLELAYTQAISLLRFRLVESNMLIKFDYKQKYVSRFVGNQAIVSMLLYLVISELITQLSHIQLLKIGENTQPAICLTECKEYFELEYPAGMKLNETILKSKLIAHLLEISKCSLNYSEQNLIFSFN